MPKAPVVAAIPNYNMAKSLKVLLPQVIEQRYDRVYVLDDASTDDSAAVVRQFKGKVHFVTGKNNVGPGANRNRLLGVAGLDDAIVHFLDADVTLDSKNNPLLARQIFTDEKLGLAGGLIKMPDGSTGIFNYGPRYSLYSIIGALYQIHVYELARIDSQKAARYQKRKHFWLKEYPNTFLPPVRQSTFWVAEGNMLIPYRIFKEIGGFDARLLYHEIQDLSIKLHKAGYEALFDPSISVTHPSFDLEDMSHRVQESHAGRRLMLTHGLPLK